MQPTPFIDTCADALHLIEETEISPNASYLLFYYLT